MPLNKVLILGGTKDAREIAHLLVTTGNDVTTSLAGVTQNPILPGGKVRVGGFGGVTGLHDYLRKESIEVLIDATHPYAVQISRHAAEAVDNLNLLHLRLERPLWVPGVDDQWIGADTVQDAVALLPSGARVLLTIGRKEIAPFVQREDLSGIVRTIEIPRDALPPRWQLVQERPPFAADRERAFMQSFGFSHLVTKNAGSNETFGKMIAARHLLMPVIVINRPIKTGGIVFHSADEARTLIKSTTLN